MGTTDTHRGVATANAIAAALDGQTFGAYTLDAENNSAPTRQIYVRKSTVDDGQSEDLNTAVSVVPRGKEKIRTSRTTWQEDLTTAVVVQQKLAQDQSAIDQVDDLVELVERIDDYLSRLKLHLYDAQPVEIHQAIFVESTINPYWRVEDLRQRQMFTGICETTFRVALDDDD